MNIFLVNKDPVICAQSLCDLRLNKMILETAQLLCVSQRFYFPEIASEYENVIYKVTHENHPCALWLRKDYKNHLWALLYFEALYKEKLYRTSKPHLSFDKLKTMLYTPIVVRSCQELNVNSVVFDFNCSGIYPSTNDVFADYKLCLLQKWLVDARLPKFSERGTPEFLSYDLQAERINYSLQTSQFNKDLFAREMLINDPIWRQHAQK